MPTDLRSKANSSPLGLTGTYTVRFENHPSNLSDVCLFSSYSFAGIVEEYVYYYLKSLKEAGFSVVFISTSKLSDACINRLQDYAFLIVERENKCPDFGSWKLGLSLLNWAQSLNTVLLANDSVFGPFRDLSNILLRMGKRFDVWGMTDSYEIDYHLQSYFLFFNKNVLLSDAWRSFWQNVDVSLSKQEVINQYEVGLSKVFFKANFRVGAYAGVDVVHKSVPHDHKYINPSLGFWRILIEQYEFPFLKREALIRKDIHKVYWQRGLYINVGNWRKLISEKTTYPVHHIDAFLNNYYQFVKKENKDIMLQKRKVLFLSHNAEIGGAQRVLLNFLKWLKEKTDIPFEILVCRPGKPQLANEFTALGNVTFFASLSDHEKYILKDRLVNEQIALIFSNTMINVEVQRFLSFLDVPQIIFAHELSYVLNAFPSVAANRDWMRNNISHFIGCAAIVRENLIKYLSVQAERTSVVHEFINDEDDNPVYDKLNEIRNFLKIPYNAFVVGLSGTFEWRKSADLLPVIARHLCNKHDDIHLIWLGADVESPLYNSVVTDIEKAGLKSKVHLVNKQSDSRPFFHLFDVFLMVSREDPFPLVNLESGIAGKPVICSKDSGGSEEYVRLGTGHAVPYLDITGLADQVLAYYNDQALLKTEKNKITALVKDNFTTAVQAPKLFEIIKQHYDEKELMLVEQSSITLMIHIFFDTTWEEIKSQIKHFDNGVNHFLFSISEACLIKEAIIEDIKHSFKNAHIVIASNVGRDIGSKMLLVNLYFLLKIHSKFIIFLHDKQSVHTFVGESWKRNLFKVVDPNNYRSILTAFDNPTVGIVGAKEHFINEYDEKTGTFRHNHEMSKLFIDRYDIAITNYEYISGTIYWLRASIIERFFEENNPIVLRTELESGNILDTKGSTAVHTWERMFCWMATNYGYTIKGI